MIFDNYDSYFKLFMNNNAILCNHLTGWRFVKVKPKINDKIDISFIKMLRDGPDVSFNGSPTVSPTTAALWTSVPFLYKLLYSS